MKSKAIKEAKKAKVTMKSRLIKTSCKILSISIHVKAKFRLECFTKKKFFKIKASKSIIPKKEPIPNNE